MVSQELQLHSESNTDTSTVIEGQISSLTQNISESGMLCRTSRKLNEMTLLDIRFQLPPKDNDSIENVWIECSGVVVHCEKKETEWIDMPYEVAIFFDCISERNRNLLAKYTRVGSINDDMLK